MARIKGGKLTVTYDTTKPQPLDSRMLVTKYEDLINPTIWETNTTTTNAAFNGMIVAVNEATYMGIYYLTDKKAITDDNYTSYQTAKAAGEDISSYFDMWTRLADLGSIQINVDGGEITQD
jgi:hypothetical protein